MRCSRVREPSPPPGTHKAPSREPASNAVQKPRKGPNENGKNTRSPAPTWAARNTSYQHSSIHAQLSLVSSTRSGSPVVDEVWQ